MEGANFVTFTEADVVRHPLVTRIVRAYNAFEKSARQERLNIAGPIATSD